VARFPPRSAQIEKNFGARYSLVIRTRCLVNMKYEIMFFAKFQARVNFIEISFKTKITFERRGGKETEEKKKRERDGLF
jgi:hypothetical protein